MRTTTEYEQTTNACEDSDVIYHRWSVWKWAEPLDIDHPEPELVTGRFLPRAYASVILKCEVCGVTHWEDIIIDIDYTPTYEFRKSEKALNRLSDNN